MKVMQALFLLKITRYLIELKYFFVGMHQPPSPLICLPQALVKTPVSVRLSGDVLGRFKASGKGWQTRMDLALQDWLKTHDPKELDRILR